MSALVNPGKAAKKARKRAEREAAALQKKEDKKNLFVDKARAAQRASFLSGRAESTQVGVGSVLGG